MRDLKDRSVGTSLDRNNIQKLLNHLEGLLKLIFIILILGLL
jgi:hypothetical protein